MRIVLRKTLAFAVVLPLVVAACGGGEPPPVAPPPPPAPTSAPALPAETPAADAPPPEPREREAREQREDGTKKAEEAGAFERSLAIRGILDKCKAKMHTVPCEVDGITDKEKADCSERCTRAIEGSLVDVKFEAAKNCAVKYFEANRKKPPTCEINLPDGHSVAPEKVTEVRGTCMNMCRERIGEAAASAAEARRAATSRGSSGGASAGKSCASTKRQCNDDCKFKPNSLNCYARCMIDASCQP